MNWRPAVDIFLPIIILGKSDIGHYLANFFCFNKTKKKLNARRRYYRREKEEKKTQFSWVRLLFSRSGHSISKEELYGKWLSEHMADALVLNFFLFCVLHSTHPRCVIIVVKRKGRRRAQCRRVRSAFFCCCCHSPCVFRIIVWYGWERADGLSRGRLRTHTQTITLYRCTEHYREKPNKIQI